MAHLLARFKNILKQINHRPWSLPKHKWNYYQEWNEVVFLHYAVNPSLLKEFVPKSLTIDC
ncbi:MAG: DUF2071 domain-containing protein, partial [Bacteroidetes bacterium]|nr:DUF2071 domain-containing protein [Bacteroidota bacterium]